MRVEAAKVRAPEIGRVWLNSPPLSFRQLRGRVVLVDFWDYTCVNCIRTLPYVQAWHDRYREKGLTVIGVHTPEFTFAQYESNVDRAVRDFGLSYPIVIDSNYEIWKLFACRCWPTKYLIDKEGYLRFAHFGEGAYDEFESGIQELLREIDPQVELPPIMKALRDEDRPGARCYRATPELYLGHRRGKIGNPSGFKEDEVADYSWSNEPEEGVFYASGHWASTAEYMESAGEGEHRITLRYSGRGVNLVMASPRAASCDVIVTQDGAPLTPRQATTDTRFRASQGQEESYIPVSTARMYAVVDNPDFGTHALELTCPADLAAFAFTFTSCVDPTLAGAPAGVPAHS
ncbi:MAG TPA: redoxin domain-containing protein [Terriglobales bacterium]